MNPDLVGCYQIVRDQTDAVISALARLQAKHRARGDRFYYEVRDERFNPVRARLHAAAGALAAERYTPELAAMLIFLNRTGFNGLFRLNRDGGFNVPVGRYTRAAHLRPRARADGGRRIPARPGVTIECAPFEAVLADAGAG